MTMDEAKKLQQTMNQPPESGSDWIALSPWTAQLSGCVCELQRLLKECNRIEQEVLDPAKRYEAIRAVIGVSLCRRDAAYTQAIKEDLQLTARLAAEQPT